MAIEPTSLPGFGYGGGRSRAPAATPLQIQPTAVPSSLAAAIDTAEAARPHSDKAVTVSLPPGRLIRASVGDEIDATVTNKSDGPISVHRHGIVFCNNMDGVELATPNIPPGGTFTYRSSVPNAGTYWAHPHTGVNADAGLYLPLIIDDPKAPRPAEGRHGSYG